MTQSSAQGTRLDTQRTIRAPRGNTAARQILAH